MKNNGNRFGICTVIFMAVIAMTISFTPAYANDGTVNVYSGRKEALILPILEKFRDQTGINFNLVTGKADGLLKRIELEGKATPADLFITVDAGRLQRAKDAGVLQTIQSDKIDAAVPAHLRDKDGYWIALSKRARTIFYLRESVDPGELSTYEQLADPMWKGRICVRSSGNIYNQSLVASMIASNGPDATQEWVNKLVVNFARPPSGGDTDQIKAVAAGECDIGLANTYYYGRLASSDKPENQEIAAKVGTFWPNQGDGDRGVHVNVSGAGVLTHSKNVQNAILLLEFLLEKDSQKWYAEVNQEYPVVPGVDESKELKELGTFKEDSLNLSVLGENNQEAVKIMDRAGWR